MSPRHPSDHRTVVGMHLLPTNRTRMCRRGRPSGGHPHRRLGIKPLLELFTNRRRRHSSPLYHTCYNEDSAEDDQPRIRRRVRFRDGESDFPAGGWKSVDSLDTRHHQKDQGVSPNCIAHHREVCLV